MACSTATARKTKLMIVGYYGAGNVGDELLLSMLISYLPSDVETIVLSENPRHTEVLHSVKSCDAHLLSEVLAHMHTCNLIVMGGGGLLQTYDSFVETDLYQFQGMDVSTYVRPLLMARQLGIPTLSWAQGIGPLNTQDSREIAKSLFEGVTRCTVRDSDSANLLKEIGVDRLIDIAPDPVWSLDWCAQRLLVERKNQLKKTIVITLRPWKIEGIDWERNLANAINYQVNPEHFRLLWLPFHISPEQIESAGQLDELAVVERVQGAIASSFEMRTSLVTSFEQLFSLLHEADFALCMRMHALILHHQSATPVMSIEYDEKLAVIAQQVGADDSLRIKMDANQEQWNEAVACLLSTTRNQGIDVNKRDDCVKKSILHRDVLEDMIQQARKFHAVRSKPIHQPDFDWIATWQNNLAQTQINSLQARLHEITSEKNNQLKAMQTVINSLTLDHKNKSEESQAMLDASAREKNHWEESYKSIQAEFNEYKLSSHREIATLKTSEHQVSQEFQIQELVHQTLKTELLAAKTTWSWRLTRPMRFVSQFMKSPSRAIYLTAKTIYWWLPPSFRQKLMALRLAYIRSTQRVPRQATAITKSGDLDWLKFCADILSRRDDYKGIFIQETVIDWYVPLYQRPQHIATALGKSGYLVIYRTNNWSHDNVNGFRQVALNVWLSNSEQVDQIEAAVRSVYSTSAVDQYKISQFPASNCMVYEYIDHIDPEISGDQDNITRLNNQKKYMLNGGASFVVTSARKLKDDILEDFDATKVILIPNGVDAEHYRAPTLRIECLPEKYTNFCLKHTICLGYFGALAPWLDYPMIAELVKSRPDVGFVFIGPDYYGGQSQLPLLSNVHITGAIDYALLPTYSKLFDLCWIPFKSGEIAKTTSPLKLFEYFAMEKPVLVSSDMLECIVYPEVLHANNAGVMSGHINSAMALAGQADFLKRLRQLADENDWRDRALQFAPIFEFMVKK
jgi:polysaccharide pyruvyl transferase CsaB